MERALYCPEVGYYERVCHTPGRRGDYFTSVSVGRVFGELLGRRLCRWVEGIPGASVSILEGGAHDGRLARDILGWVAAARPDCYERLEYVILEPSPHRRRWQAEALVDFGGKLRWVKAWSEFEAASVRGVVLANELLDSMPVVRLGWDADARSWFEWGVGWSQGKFYWVETGRVSPLPECAEQWLGSVTVDAGELLPDRCVVEIAPAALEWWQQAARSLRQGYLAALDYGWDLCEGWRWSRLQGSLRAYQNHRMVDDVLQRPGELDLTAHVPWSLVRATGEATGLRTVTFMEQGRWLAGIVSEEVSAGRPLPRWSPAEVRQFHTLTHPAYLGAKFQVLVQSKGLSADPGVGLATSAAPRTAEQKESGIDGRSTHPA